MRIVISADLYFVSSPAGTVPDRCLCTLVCKVAGLAPVLTRSVLYFILFYFSIIGHRSLRDVEHAHA